MGGFRSFSLKDILGLQLGTFSVHYLMAAHWGELVVLRVYLSVRGLKFLWPGSPAKYSLTCEPLDDLLLIAKVIEIWK